jgi:hypothetical protein
MISFFIQEQVKIGTKRTLLNIFPPVSELPEMTFGA